MDFLILGPIEVRDGPRVVNIEGNKPRAVLAVLLLHANEAVSAERLALALWGEDAPSRTVKTIQVNVSRLRKALGGNDVITTTPAGYCLRLLPGELDAAVFEGRVEDGRRALADGHHGNAAAILREALALWRGPALADLALAPFAAIEIARLEEQRLAALELRLEADLAAGDHASVVGELQRLVSEHPKRERLAGQLMLALYRCGRQSDALAAYAAARRVLVDEIGVEPGPQLRELHGAILRQDEELQGEPELLELPPALDAMFARALVGREAELSALRAHWERACAGEGALVALTGPRGVGKRRLAAELAGEVNRPGVSVQYLAGGGDAQAIIDLLRRVARATRPTLLVVDAADRAGSEVHRELASLVPAIAAAPVLVVVCAQEALALAHLRAGGALELGALDAEAVRAIAALHAPTVAVADVPAEWLLEASGGVPSRVHEVAGQWARREAVRHVDAAAGRAEAGRAQLREIEAELTGGVVALQGTGDRDPPRAGTGGDEGSSIVCPFKGPASYAVEDAHYFCGREQLVAEFIARLVGSPLLGIVGPSGSGKSSLLRAGLLPALASGTLPGSKHWPQVVLRPGKHPLRELAEGLASVAGSGRTILAIDQFEETFTACEDEDERAEFVSELVAAAQDRDRRWVVVIALRADYYGRCAEYPQLSSMLAASNLLVRPMQSDELRRAIEIPAQRAQLRIEPELVDALVADVEQEPGGLPLMSTALLELWQCRDGRRLRYAAYVRTGGVRGAVARLAERAFAQLDESQQQIARAVLMRLVGSGDLDAVERRRVALEELEVASNDGVARVLALLTDSRLLTVDEGSVELAHEALLREWPRLRGWIAEDHDGLRIQAALSAAATEWERLRRDDGALYRGTRMGEAVEWRQARQPVLNASEREFLAASELAREREHVTRRRRTALAVGSAGTVILAVVVVAIIAVLTGRERDVVASRDIAARSASIVGSDPGLALALARAALDRHDTEPAKLALRQATFANRMVGVLPAGHGGLAELSTSSEGGLVASAGGDGTVQIARLADRRVIGTVKPTRGGAAAGATAVSLSHDAKRVVIAYGDGEIAVANVDGSARKRLTQLADMDYARGLDVSADGSLIAVGTAQGGVRVLGASGSGPDRELGRSGSIVWAVSFDRSAKRIATVSDDDSPRVWNVATGDSRALGPVARTTCVSFAADGRVVAGDAAGDVSVWNAATGKRLKRFHVTNLELLAVDVSADGREIVTGAADGAVRVSDARSGALLSDMRGHAGNVNDVEFAPAKRTIVSAGEDGTLRFWNPPVVAVSARTGTAVGYGRDDRIVTGAQSGDVWLWNPKTGDERRIARGESPSVASFSADGDEVAIASYGGATRLYDVGTGKLRDVPASVGQFAAAVDRSGGLVAFGGGDGKITLKRPDGGARRMLSGHGGEIFALAFSSDGRHLVSGSRDTTVRIWDVASGRAERVLRGHEQPVEWVAYSDDGRYVASTSDDGTVRVWPVGSGTPTVLVGHRGRVNTVQFGPRGDFVVSAGDDGTVRVWDARGGEQLVVLRTSDGPAYGADFSPDGTHIVSTGADQMAVTPCDVCGSMKQVLRAAGSRPQRKLTADERRRLLAEG